MPELLKFMINQFAEKTELIEYDVEETDGAVNITVTLDSSDMGKVIGRQGKLAKAIRTVMKSAAQKENKKCNIEIKERGEI